MPCQDRFVRAGATSHNAIAAKLNERNVRTRGAECGRMCRLGRSCTLSTQASPSPSREIVRQVAPAQSRWRCDYQGWLTLPRGSLS
jgi:hypothetical protein